jgi:uncharacterized membrane protein YdjX (TVP38/TMEM64 family)
VFSFILVFLLGRYCVMKARREKIGHQRTQKSFIHFIDDDDDESPSLS